LTVFKLDSNKTRVELGEIMKIKGGPLRVTLRTGKGVYLPFPAEQRLYKFLRRLPLFGFHKGKYIRIADNIGD